jgi:hypothetical protein
MKQLSKAGRKHFRELADLSYERELGRALDELLLQFERWKKGEIDAFELNEKIHEHHNGIARELYKLYASGEADFTVVRALVRGILEEKEVDERFLPFLRPTLEYYKKRRDVGSK